MNNVKRTWVNYGYSRDWTDPRQGQVHTCMLAMKSGLHPLTTYSKTMPLSHDPMAILKISIVPRLPFVYLHWTLVHVFGMLSVTT